MGNLKAQTYSGAGRSFPRWSVKGRSINKRQKLGQDHAGGAPDLVFGDGQMRSFDYRGTAADEVHAPRRRGKQGGERRLEQLGDFSVLDREGRQVVGEYDNGRHHKIAVEDEDRAELARDREVGFRDTEFLF